MAMRRRRSSGLAIALAFPLVLGAPASATRADPGPAEPVAAFTDTLLATMKNAKSLGFDGRREQLAPALRATFDFRFMARLALGSHWSKLDDGQQARFVDLFADMSIATFAARFDGYSGQRFEVGEPKDGPRETRLVPTRLVHPDASKEPVTISYLMRQDERGWHAVDVYLKGTYSEVAAKRSEYTSVIKRKGYEALVERLRRKIAELRGTDGNAAGDGS